MRENRGGGRFDGGGARKQRELGARDYLIPFAITFLLYPSKLEGWLPVAGAEGQ